MFAAIGLSEAEARGKFGALLDALQCGAPPHGGIAFGLDRLVMLLAGKHTHILWSLTAICQLDDEAIFSAHDIVFGLTALSCCWLVSVLIYCVVDRLIMVPVRAASAPGSASTLQAYFRFLHTSSFGLLFRAKTMCRHRLACCCQIEQSGHAPFRRKLRLRQTTATSSQFSV